MSDQKNPLLTMAINFVTNPWVLAGVGGAAGYYFFGRKDGKTVEGKRPYIAAGVGAAAGLAAGKLIQHYRMQPAQLTPPQAQQAQIQAAQQAAQAAEAAEYYDMDSVETDVDSVFQQAQAQPQAPQVPLQADINQPVGLGSLDGSTLGSSSLGSFDREAGFDAFDRAIDSAIEDAN